MKLNFEDRKQAEAILADVIEDPESYAREVVALRKRATFSTLSSRRSWEWPTPKHFYDELNAEFNFNFDPCPLGGAVDGTSPLLSDWRGKRVFCNPPYGPEIHKFLGRAHEAEIAVYLLPARTDTAWFHDIVLPQAKEVRFIRGRLYNQVINGEPNNNRWPFPSMVVIFESRTSQRENGGTE